MERASGNRERAIKSRGKERRDGGKVHSAHYLINDM